LTGYRLFLLRDEHIHSAQEFAAETDAAALAQAESLRGDQPAELWSLARMIRKFPVAEAHRQAPPRLR
jgi:hypothetical protein